MPKPIEALMNQHKVYQLNNGSKDANGNLRFAVNRVYRTEVGDKRILEQPSSNSESTGKRPMVTEDGTPLQPYALGGKEQIPGTPELVARKATVKAEATPLEASGSATKYTTSKDGSPLKPAAHPKAMKELFKDKGGFL